MPWANIDDQFHAHRKAKRAWKSPRALGLHLLAMSYCAGMLTDGFVDDEFIEEKMPRGVERKAATDALVSAGLWERSEDGWQIHDWLEYNPSRASIEEKRAKDRQRKRGGTPKDSGASRLGVGEDSTRNPDGVVEDSIPHAGARGVDGSGVEGNASSLSKETRGFGARADGKVDQLTPPRELAAKHPEVAARLDEALAILVAVQTERGGNAPTPRGVGLALLRFPDRDHLAVAHDLQHWALAGRGQSQPVRDWARTYATFLERTPAGAPSRIAASANTNTNAIDALIAAQLDEDPETIEGSVAA